LISANYRIDLPGVEGAPEPPASPDVPRWRSNEMTETLEQKQHPTRPKLWGPSTASLAGALAAALAPQTADAALITVGGDGGVGSVTLENKGDRTNLGGLLLQSITYRPVEGIGGYLRFVGVGGRLHVAVRSSDSTRGNQLGDGWSFAGNDGLPRENALWDSSDNWVPGQFRVNGVNGGNLIWGWLHVRLGPGPGDFDPTILSFTYDDEATGVTPFIKPIGGFSVPETDPVPEPSTLGLFGLGLGAAFVSRLRRRKKAEQDG